MKLELFYDITPYQDFEALCEAVEDGFFHNLTKSFKSGYETGYGHFDQFAAPVNFLIKKHQQAAEYLSKKTGLTLPVTLTMVLAGVTGGTSAIPMIAISYFVRKHLNAALAGGVGFVVDKALDAAGMKGDLNVPNLQQAMGELQKTISSTKINSASWKQLAGRYNAFVQGLKKLGPEDQKVLRNQFAQVAAQLKKLKPMFDTDKITNQAKNFYAMVSKINPAYQIINNQVWNNLAKQYNAINNQAKTIPMTPASKLLKNYLSQSALTLNKIKPKFRESFDYIHETISFKEWLHEQEIYDGEQYDEVLRKLAGQAIGATAGYVSGFFKRALDGLTGRIQELYRFAANNPRQMIKMAAVMGVAMATGGVIGKISDMTANAVTEKLGSLMSGVDPKEISQAVTQITEKGSGAFSGGTSSSGDFGGSDQAAATGYGDNVSNYNSNFGNYELVTGPNGEQLYHSEDGNFYKIVKSKLAGDLYQKVDPDTGNRIGLPSHITNYRMDRAMGRGDFSGGISSSGDFGGDEQPSTSMAQGSYEDRLQAAKQKFDAMGRSMGEVPDSEEMANAAKNFNATKLPDGTTRFIPKDPEAIATGAARSQPLLQDEPSSIPSELQSTRPDTYSSIKPSYSIEDPKNPLHKFKIYDDPAIRRLQNYKVGDGSPAWVQNLIDAEKADGAGSALSTPTGDVPSVSYPDDAGKAFTPGSSMPAAQSFIDRNAAIDPDRVPQPGDPNFGEYLRKRIEFQNQQADRLGKITDDLPNIMPNIMKQITPEDLDELNSMRSAAGLEPFENPSQLSISDIAKIDRFAKTLGQDPRYPTMPSQPDIIDRIEGMPNRLAAPINPNPDPYLGSDQEKEDYFSKRFGTPPDDRKPFIQTQEPPPFPRSPEPQEEPSAPEPQATTQSEPQQRYDAPQRRGLPILRGIGKGLKNIFGRGR